MPVDCVHHIFENISARLLRSRRMWWNLTPFSHITLLLTLTRLIQIHCFPKDVSTQRGSEVFLNFSCSIYWNLWERCNRFLLTENNVRWGNVLALFMVISDWIMSRTSLQKCIYMVMMWRAWCAGFARVFKLVKCTWPSTKASQYSVASRRVDVFAELTESSSNCKLNQFIYMAILSFLKYSFVFWHSQLVVFVELRMHSGAVNKRG